MRKILLLRADRALFAGDADIDQIIGCDIDLDNEVSFRAAEILGIVP